MNIGLKRGSVVLEEHNPRWSDEFERESTRLKAILPEHIAPFEHVGSTSIPGIPAKPIIDFMAGVKDLNQSRQCFQLLTQDGYQHRPNGDNANRVFFVRGPESCRTHHFSLVTRDSTQWRNSVGFRDKLRSDPELAKRYANLKRKLAEAHPLDRGAYTKAKEPFFEEVFQLLKQ